jgi:hypothetical protein
MAEKIKWVYDQFHSPEWTNRLIFTTDKTLLQGDYLIDCDPNPESTYQTLGNGISNMCFKPTWQHIVFDQAYNKSLENKIRLEEWTSWKTILGLDNMPGFDTRKLQYFNHGSTDSLDVDRYYLFPKMPSEKECHMFVAGVEDDRNPIAMNEELGVVTNCFKGFPDECNNEMVRTYPLHKQDFPLPVKRLVTRLTPVKLLGAIRKLLGLFHRAVEYTDIIHATLKQPFFAKRVELFKEIDYVKCTGLDIKRYKTAAAQMSQTICLLQGEEVFTKAECTAKFPDLKPFLYREEEFMLKNLHILNNYRDILVSLIDGVDFVQKDDVLLFSCKNPQPGNQFHYQSNGLVVECENLCIGYPFDNYQAPLPSRPSWIRPEQEFPITPLVENNSAAHYFVSIYRMGRNTNLKFSGQDALENETIAQVKDIFKKNRVHRWLDFERFTYIFELVGTDAIHLVGMRCKYTNELQTHDAVKALNAKILSGA